MTDAQRRKAVRQFVEKWRGRGNEDEDGRSYWLDLLTDVMGVDRATDYVDFEKKVIVDGNTKRIDAYLPETHVIIEQKSLGKKLDQKLYNSGDVELTPYEQAKRYNDNLPYDEKARWIIASNFEEIWAYDMNARVPEPVKISLSELPVKFPFLDFLVKKDVKAIPHETKVSIQAGEVVGLLYNAFLKQYRDPESERALKSLNVLCVRLVFCLYAEDAGIFGRRKMFHDYLAGVDTPRMRTALIELFRILDQKPEERDPYLIPELAEFPYVNGGLFEDEDIEIPMFTDEIRELLLVKASEDFNWSEISPTIFGAVFESTLNPETRRSGGMHYTSIENIHKVIDPLFLDALKEELSEIEQISVLRTRKRKLEEFQKKLASLEFLDPAAGSGNFLTETYLSLRRLENEALRNLYGGQVLIGEAFNPIQVSISQFHGIEINDFAVTVAKTALWIAESQMMKETEDVVMKRLEFLPLETNANIVEANALRIDWNDVVPASQLNYIMGNPPFVGYSLQSETQKEDIKNVYRDSDGKTTSTAGKIDYVAGWYYLAAKTTAGTPIRTAFVSTNSITQGEQVAFVWEELFKQFKIEIDFAYRTFIWGGETRDKASVHCVIIGFSGQNNAAKPRIFDGDKIEYAEQINPYLIDAPMVFIHSRTNPLCDVPKIRNGSKPADGGFLFLTPDERRTFIESEPDAQKYIRRVYGSEEFINDKERYCLWLTEITPKELNSLPLVRDRVKKVQEFRLKSKKAATIKSADTPTLFQQIRQPELPYVVVPRVSSENRRYIPMGYESPETIVTDSVQYIPNASMYTFGVVVSCVHMAWTSVVCGRLKSDYRYSAKIVYNNFPWPDSSDSQKREIERSARGILEARALYPDSSLADLYDALSMPPELRKAHAENDRAVMAAYGFTADMSESDCVAELMRRYQKLVVKKP
ncbi:MAG: class I SAM-dependent DNA methyltransferase [Thermoguttaceae bacterium]|jgi:type I restriction-modification system DNA methylase subunit